MLFCRTLFRALINRSHDPSEYSFYVNEIDLDFVLDGSILSLLQQTLKEMAASAPAPNLQAIQAQIVQIKAQIDIKRDQFYAGQATIQDIDRLHDQLRQLLIQESDILHQQGKAVSPTDKKTKKNPRSLPKP